MCKAGIEYNNWAKYTDGTNKDMLQLMVSLLDCFSEIRV